MSLHEAGASGGADSFVRMGLHFLTPIIVSLRVSAAYAFLRESGVSSEDAIRRVGRTYGLSRATVARKLNDAKSIELAYRAHGKHDMADLVSFSPAIVCSMKESLRVDVASDGK